MAEVYDHYFRAVEVPDPEEAFAVLDDALTAGVPAEHLILDVVARAQRVAGEKWMRGEWTIADEHAATSVAKQALTRLAAPPPRPSASRHVLVACAEGEWHSLPARMAGELLSAPDLRVEVLGPSTTVERLRQHLRSSDPDVLALSVTMPTNLISAAASIEAARAEGIPVVVGGAAWGRGQRRARVLGAHARLDDIRDLRFDLDKIRSVQPSPPFTCPPEARWLDEVPDSVVHAAFELHAGTDPRLAGASPQERREWEQQQRWTCRFAAAALACRDSSVVADMLDWTVSLCLAREQPVAPRLLATLCLADALETRAPRGAMVLREEVAAVGRRHESSGMLAVSEDG